MSLRSAGLALFALLALVPDASAGYDAAFNGGHPVFTSVTCANREVGAILQWPDGDVGVAGSETSYAPCAEGPGSSFFVMRRNPDGTPHEGFGDADGVVRSTLMVAPEDAEVLADGSVLVSGSRDYMDDDPAVVKLTPEGEVDTSFGEGGRATFPAWITATREGGLDVLPDGGIVAAFVGHKRVRDPDSGITYTYYALSAYKLSAAGQLDTSFGDAGLAQHVLPSGWPREVDVHVQPSGRIVLGGSTHAAVSADAVGNAFLVAFTSGGLLDTSFGESNGQVLATSAGGGDFVLGRMAVAPDGDLLVVGETWGDARPGLSWSVTLRTTANGQRDTAWGPAGVKETDALLRPDAHADDRIRPEGASMDGDGRLLVAGRDVYDQWVSGAVAARLNADGTRDTGFGNSGGFNDFADLSMYAGAYEIAADADGRVLVAGHEVVQDAKATRAWLARLPETAAGGPDGPPAGGDTTGGSTDGTSGGSTSDTSGGPVTGFTDLETALGGESTPQEVFRAGLGMIIPRRATFRRSTASFNATAPGPGTVNAQVFALTASASAARTRPLGTLTKSVAKAGKVTLKIRLKRKAAKRLLRKRSFKVRLATHFTPRGGQRGPRVSRVVTLSRR